MRYVRAEEVLLPTRFIVQTAHFIAVLTVLFDIVRHHAPAKPLRL
jgi:hypothetical protein